MIDKILEEYRSIYGEDIDKEFVENLLSEYDEDSVRRLLGLTIAIGKKVYTLDNVQQGGYVRLKIVKLRDEKDVSGKRIRIYLASDHKSAAIVTDRVGKSIEVGKRYLIGPLKIRRQAFIGNIQAPEIYLYENTEVYEILSPHEAIEIEELSLDPKPFARRPFIASIEGVVKNVGQKTITLDTDYGEIYVSMPKYLLSGLSRGDVIRIIGVHPDKHGLEASAIAKIEKLGKKEVKREEYLGVVIEATRKTSSKGNAYYIYTIFDGRNITKAFHRTEASEIAIGDLVRFEGRKISKGISLERIEVVKRRSKRSIEGTVDALQEISKYSPRYIAKIGDALIATDKELKQGEEVKLNAIGAEIEGKFIGRESEEEEIGTVIGVEYDGEYSKALIHVGDTEIEVTLRKDLRPLEGKDVKIIRDQNGSIIALVEA